MESDSKPTTQRPRRRMPWFALGVLVGIALTLMVPWAVNAAYGLNLGQHWQATQDIDLAKAYFFSPELQSPIKGTLTAGSMFTVNWLHGGAAYVRFEHVFDRRQMAEFARQLDKAEYDAVVRGKRQ